MSNSAKTDAALVCSLKRSTVRPNTTGSHYTAPLSVWAEMTLDKKEIGSRGERAALRYLRRSGMRLRTRNWRSKSGEVDIVMQHGQTIVFVEVRSRTSPFPGPPLNTLGAPKERRMVRVAEDYLYRYRLIERPWRIDCVFVTFDARGTPAIEHVPNAV